MVSLFLVGCVGVTYTRVDNKPANKEAYSKYCKGLEETPSTLITKEAIRLAHGEPHEVETISNNEVWRYKKEGYLWSGPTLWLIIPIPLKLPTSSIHYTVEFEGDYAVNIYRSVSTTTNVICGPFVIMMYSDAEGINQYSQFCPVVTRTYGAPFFREEHFY